MKRSQQPHTHQRWWTHRSLSDTLSVVCLSILMTSFLAHGTTVTIGTVVNTAVSSHFIASLYASGLEAPVGVASGNGMSYSATISLTSITGPYPPTFGTVDALLQQGAVAIHGLPGTWMMANQFSPYQSLSTNRVYFGPLAESLDGAFCYNCYFSSVFWTIPMDGAQALGLLYYLAQQPFFPRNQFALIQGTGSSFPYSGVGSTAQLLFRLEMSKLGVTQFYSVYVSPYNVPSASRIGVAYMFGQLYGTADHVEYTNFITTSWMNTLFSDSALITMNATVAATFYVQNAMQQAYQSKLSSGLSLLPPQNVIFSAPTPGVDSTEYSVSQEFLSQVTSFPGCTQNVCKNLILAGWVTATALIHAISMYGGSNTITFTHFFNNLVAAQSTFLVSDLFIGSFGPKSAACSSTAQSQGGVCHCNQAGVNIFFSRLSVTGTTVDVVTIPGATFQFATEKCASVIPPGDTAPVVTPYTDLFTYGGMSRLVGLSPTDNAMMMDMCDTVSAVSTALSNRRLYKHRSLHGYAASCTTTAMSRLDYDLSARMSMYVTTSMTGVIPDSMVNSIATPSTFVLDFMPQTTQPRVMQSNLVYLFPTLDQELYVLVPHLYEAMTASSVVCGVVRTSSASNSIVALLTKTLTTFGMTVASGHMVQTSGVLGSSIPSACTHTFVVGLDEGDAAGIATNLQSHPSAVVILSFDDVTKYYSSLQMSIGGLPSSVTDRLVFATNLPSWTDTPSDPTAASASVPLSTVSQFLQSVPDSLHTPASLRAFIVAMMYDLLSADQGSNPDVQDLLYAAVTVFLDGTMFGPFSMDCTSIGAPTSGACVSNTGATTIAVWSYTRVVTPTTPLLAPGMVPSMIYNVLGRSTRFQNGASGTSQAGLTATCVSWLSSSALESFSDSKNSSTVSSSSSTPGPSIPPTLSLSSGSHANTSSAVNELLLVLVVLLVVALFVVLLLLLWKCQIIQPIVTCLQQLCAHPSCECSAPSMKAQDDQLSSKTVDISRWVPSSEEPRTIVVVQMDHWRALWVRVPEVMRSVAEYYQRCVREAVLQHGCVELRAVGGLFVLLCPSALSSVLLVKDIRHRLDSMSSAQRAVMALMYRSFGMAGDEPEAQQLCVRVGVDTNRIGSGPIGPAWCGQGCAEVATRVAHRSSTHNDVLCVMTERTRSALSEEQLLSMHVSLPSAGLHALHCGQEEVVLELYVLSCSAASHTALSASPASERLSERALEMVSGGMEVAVGSAANVVCTGVLRALHAGLSPCRVELLESIQRWFSLAIVRRHADASGYADALLSSVSTHLAALLVCRHGLSPGAGRCHRGPDASHVQFREGCDGDHGEWSSDRTKQSGRYSVPDRSRRVMLRRFAYGSLGLADGGNEMDV